MRFLACFAAFGVLGFYTGVTTPPNPKGFELTQPHSIFQSGPTIFRVQVSPRLIAIHVEGDILVKNLAPKCSLYYGLSGEPLRVGEGVAQAGQNEVKPTSEKTIRAQGILSLICAPGQAFPVEIQKL